MEKTWILAFVCLFSLLPAVTPAMIFYPQLPIDKWTLFKAQIALNNWENDLNNNYGTPKENPRRMKWRTDLVIGQLRQMSKQLSAYNNVAYGAQNAVAGSKNLIIGNRNSVYGDNNFIFSEGFYYANVKDGNPQKKINNYLVNDNWVGELDKRKQIPTKMHDVIYPYQ